MQWQSKYEQETVRMGEEMEELRYLLLLKISLELNQIYYIHSSEICDLPVFFVAKRNMAEA